MPGPEDTPGSAPTSPGDREGTGHGHDFALVSPATWRSGSNEQPRAAEPHGILFLQPRGQESGGQPGAPRPQPSAERGTKSGGAGEAQGPATPAAVRPPPPSHPAGPRRTWCLPAQTMLFILGASRLRGKPTRRCSPSRAGRRSGGRRESQAMRCGATAEGAAGAGKRGHNSEIRHSSLKRIRQPEENAPRLRGAAARTPPPPRRRAASLRRETSPGRAFPPLHRARRGKAAGRQGALRTGVPA